MQQSEIQKKNKILISFLGTGNYEKVNYQLNGKAYESELSIIPVYDYLRPDKVYIIGTKDSSWNLISDIPYEHLEIPMGKSPEEFWQMFDLLSQKIQLQNGAVSFDITHCFRSIPFFAVIFIQFIKFLEQTAEIEHIFYGFFDSRTKESHIIDLRPMLELLDWLEALTSLRKYGDLDDLCILVERAEKEIRGQGVRNIKLSTLKKELKELAGMTKMTYVPQLGAISETLSTLLKDDGIVSESKLYLKPLYLLLPELRKMIHRFNKPNEWESQLEIARWYLENKNPTQALLVLRETIVTYSCLEAKLDPYDSASRQDIEKKLSEAVKDRSQDKLHVLWDKVTQSRNKVAHALMKKREDIDPNKAMKKVNELILEAENLLKERKNES